MPFYLRRTRLPGNPADDYEVFDAKQVTKRLNVKHRCRQRAQDADRRRHMLDLARNYCNVADVWLPEFSLFASACKASTT